MEPYKVVAAPRNVPFFVTEALSGGSPVAPKSRPTEGQLENGVTPLTYREMSWVAVGDVGCNLARVCKTL